MPPAWTNISFSGGGGTGHRHAVRFRRQRSLHRFADRREHDGGQLFAAATGFETRQRQLHQRRLRSVVPVRIDGDDHFTASSTTATLQGAGMSSIQSGYDTVVAVGGYGNDLASIHRQPPETRRSSAISNAGSLSGTGFYLRAENFDRVEARSTGGDDVAYLWDSAGDDAFAAVRSSAYFNGSEVYARRDRKSFRPNRLALQLACRGVDRASLYATLRRPLRCWKYART